ncbi:MAG: NAD(+)/NADH kinase [Dehalococcoidia bacterium]|nr:NAD(+)/NADH kinase [Dehalococcoidia bacterium]
MKKIGIFFHPELPRARVLAGELKGVLDAMGAPNWACSAKDEAGAARLVPGTDLLVALGGDGTMLRAARAAVSDGTPILGVRLGRVGFLSEVEPEAAIERVRAYQNGEGWIEDRAMLSVSVNSSGRQQHALNDAVVSRGARPRVVHVQASIDGQLFTTFTADGVILATPTGSTGYSMAAGGPLVHPGVRAILLTPIAAHLSLNHPLVLPVSASIELRVFTDHSASLTVDGQLDTQLNDADAVHVRLSDMVTRFLRFGPSSHYYGVLSQRLKCKE